MKEKFIFKKFNYQIKLVLYL